MNEALTTAQELIALSMINPHVDFVVLAVERGGIKDTRNVMRFPDGSAITFTSSVLPVEYVGG